VLADRVQIEQVVLNLLRNGIEATAESTQREFAVRTTRRDQQTVEIWVANNGQVLPGKSPLACSGLTYINACLETLWRDFAVPAAKRTLHVAFGGQRHSGRFFAISVARLLITPVTRTCRPGTSLFHAGLRAGGAGCR
jgi:hypothetical protein